jgi:hypothetical protein
MSIGTIMPTDGDSGKDFCDSENNRNDHADSVERLTFIAIDHHDWIVGLPEGINHGHP